MSYERQPGFSGTQQGLQTSAQDIGAKIAGHHGGTQFESKPGASLLGGAAPTTSASAGNSGVVEPGYEHVSAPSLGKDTGTASIAGGGINQATAGTGTSASTAPTGTTGQAVGTAQKTAEPYVTQAKEAAAPYVQKAQEVGAAAMDSARPYLNQAAGVAGKAGQVASEKAAQAYSAATTELDARGINRDSTQQKLAEVGQTMKDYGTVGQQRAGEYFQQAVDQAKTIGQDRENKSIVTTIFGTVFLVWLAFGFSIGAIFALGVAGSIAAVLSRYSRGHGGAASTGQIPSGRVAGTTSNLATPGVETHYPQPTHPDNSLNTAKGL